MNHSFRSVLSRLALPTLSLALLAHGAEARAQCTTINTSAYWETYGVGCGTPPVLGASANPVLGTVINLDTTSQPPAAYFTVTGLSLTAIVGGIGTGLPFPCLRFIGPWVPINSFPVLGTSSVAFAIPNDPGLTGLVVYAQSGSLTTNALWIEVSNAVCLHLGS